MEDVMSKKKCGNKIGDYKMSAQIADHDGWFICDGRELDREEYAELFAIIGTSFGAGDGKTTFNLPDFSDKMAGKYRIIKDSFIVAGSPKVAGCVKGGVFVPACKSIGTVTPNPLYSQKKLDDEVELKVFILAKRL